MMRFKYLKTFNNFDWTALDFDIFITEPRSSDQKVNLAETVFQRTDNILQSLELCSEEFKKPYENIKMVPNRAQKAIINTICTDPQSPLSWGTNAVFEWWTMPGNPGTSKSKACGKLFKNSENSRGKLEENLCTINHLNFLIST